MCQPMVLVDITTNIERDLQAEVVVYPCFRQQKIVFSEMVDHCMVNDYIEFLFVNKQ